MNSSEEVINAGEAGKKLLNQELLVLLYAWAQCAKFQGKQIPEKHWEKMNKVLAKTK
jgi:hypothetical protein